MDEKEDKFADAEKTWELLSKSKDIEPSPDFKVRFWQRLRREEEAVSLWDWLRNPWVVQGLAGALALWILGVSIGIKVFGKPLLSTSPTSTSFAALLEPYPPNSIEQVVLGGKL